MCLLKSITGAHSLSVKKQQGTAALEFVLIAPVFFLVLLGSLSYAWAFYVQTTFHAAAENGVQAVLQMDRSSYDLPAKKDDFKSDAKVRVETAVKQSLGFTEQKITAEGVTINSSFAQTTSAAGEDYGIITVTVKRPTDGLPYMVGVQSIEGRATASYW